MTSPTHVVFSELVFLMFLTTAQISLTPLNALLVAAGALVPDLDSASTYVGKLLPFIARRVERRFGHRTFTHSLLFTAILALALLPLVALDKDPYLCLLAGCLSHMFLDTMTVTGVCLLYPFSSRRCVFPMDVNHPHSYRVQTGSRVDHTFGVIFLLGCLPAFLIAHQGYDRFVRAAQRDIESAVRDYNDFSRHSTVSATVSAYDMFTKEHIRGEYEVIGALNQETLVFEGAGGRIHTLGKEYRATYVAENVICHEGSAVLTRTRSVDLSNQPLSQIRAYVDTNAVNHLFGTVWTDVPASIGPGPGVFSPVIGVSGEIRLNYARLSDLEVVAGAFVIRGSITIRTLVPIPGGSEIVPPGQERGRVASYTQVVFLAEITDPVVFQHRTGDNVAAGTILATIGGQAAGGERRMLIQEKIVSVERELETKLDALQAQVDRETDALRRDSADLVHVRRLRSEGFSPGSANSKLMTATAISRERLRAHRRSARIVTERARISTLKLRTELAEMETRHQRKTRSERISSPVAGVITDIRQERTGVKIRYIVTMRLKEK